MIEEKTRALFAVVVAPVAGCLLGTVAFGLVGLIAGDNPAAWSALILLPIYGFAYGVSVGVWAMVFAGIPAHLLLKRLGARAVWAYALAGVVIGLATPFAFTFFIRLAFDTYTLQQVRDDAIGMLPLGAWLGLCISVIAWLIRRPDRDARTNPPTSPS